ncbi:hypothetical protein [Paenibacillus sp. FSL R7-0333]|uniref:hypothetical protein n=1 Tax=Paenibacillus sp. FSL R7-0333 TaxID=1926587 RepID=UPI00096EDAA1|nr:hypothetical protein BK146_16570 [Paenibacillus sp. FSL R7-0333]
MKIYKDGTLEGTPEELAAYAKLQTLQPFKVIEPITPLTGQPYRSPETIISTTGIDAGKYPGGDQGPYRVDITRHPYDRNRAVFAFNGDPETNGIAAITTFPDRVVSEITGVIS